MPKLPPGCSLHTVSLLITLIIRDSFGPWLHITFNYITVCVSVLSELMKMTMNICVMPTIVQMFVFRRFIRSSSVTEFDSNNKPVSWQISHVYYKPNFKKIGSESSELTRKYRRRTTYGGRHWRQAQRHMELINNGLNQHISPHRQGCIKVSPITSHSKRSDRIESFKSSRDSLATLDKYYLSFKVLAESQLQAVTHEIRSDFCHREEGKGDLHWSSVWNSIKQNTWKHTASTLVIEGTSSVINELYRELEHCRMM